MRFLLAALICFASFCGPADAGSADPRSTLLFDQRGEPFRLAELRGRPALLTFVATRCSDACPLANAAFAKLAQRLRNDRIGARLVTITLDPEYDTPFVMAHFAQAFGAQPQSWTFASGSVANVRSLLRSFGVVAAKDKRGIPELHSSLVYVLDDRVRLSQTLLLSTTLDRDAEHALKEVGSAPR